MTEELPNDGLPPWPQMPEGWDFDPSAIVQRRTAPLFVGAIVFVYTQNRVYRRRWNGRYHEGVGGPVERYKYEARKIVGETRVSWLLTQFGGMTDLDRCEKVPKRQLATIYGRADVEDALWIGAHQHKIAGAVGALRERGQETRAQLEAVAQILGMKIEGGDR